jgi:hypothetical protein
MNARSTMQSKVEAYLTERRREGFALRIEGQQLGWFARFTDSIDRLLVSTTRRAVWWAKSQ